ncbi:MAG: hypothetical protein AAGD28_31985 [Bacteroidota bacterium]
MCFSRRHQGGPFADHKHSYRRRHRGPGSIIGFVVRAFILKFLWNMLIPSLFGGPAIGFLHAAGLLLLGKVITGGNGPRGSRRKHREWKWKMKEKMDKMTPEERREFKEKMLGWEVNVIEVEDEDTKDEDADKGKKKK